MTESDLTKPMTSRAQIIGYTVINGNAETITYFAGVDNQKDIESHRAKLIKKHKLDNDHKIEFVLRQRNEDNLKN